MNLFLGFNPLNYVIVAIVAIFLLPKLAHQNNKESTKIYIFISLLIPLVMALIMPTIVKQRASSNTVDALQSYCDNNPIGETIYRSVPGVDSFYISTHHKGLLFQHDRLSSSFVLPPNKMYRSVESRLEKFEHKPKYGVFSRTDLTLSKDQRVGIQGDETVIVDMENNEVLAKRLFYYSKQKGIRGKMQFCDGYRPDNLNNSYSFVSKVLIPTAYNKTERAKYYDLDIGTGKKKKSCIFTVNFGPGVTQENIRFSTNKNRHNDLIISLADTQDTLNCTGYYWVGRSQRKWTFTFADGTEWHKDDIEPLVSPHYWRNKSL